MKKIGSYAILCLFLFTTFAFAVEKFDVDPQKYVNQSGFLGYVQDRFIVVLKDDVAVDHAKESRSSMGLSEKLGISEVAKANGVYFSRPQFPGADLKVGQERLARYYKVYLAEENLDKAMAAYAASPMVDHVEKIGISTVYATPNDGYYDNPPVEFPYDQWHYWDTYGMRANTAWDSETGNQTVLVGDLDIGTKYDHGDLGGSNPPGPTDASTNGNIWVNTNEIVNNGIDDDGNGYVDDIIGWDFVESTDWYIYSCVDADCGGADNDPSDGDGHGTHTAGTIAAITNNGYAVAGVAGGWGDGTFAGGGNGVKVVPCRIGYVLKYRGQNLGVVIMDYVAEAMYYMGDLKAAGWNVAAINCSFGSTNSGGLGAACDYLISQDVVVCVAAGNSSSSSPDYLGSRGDCIDVAATDQSGGPASFTNYGSWVDIAAPGVSVVSTITDPSDPSGDYVASLDGTSMACPHVTGVVALLESYDPSLSAADKIAIITDPANTNPYSGTKDLGAGIIDARKCLDAVGPNTDPPVAQFTGSPTSGEYPLTVDFTDQSTNTPTSWSWDFGDGVGTSTAQNPSYTYNSAGTYTVTLTATNAYGSDDEVKIDYITVTAPAAPVADFVGSPTTGYAPLTVNFTDLSTGTPTSWSWDFGDGVGTSTAQNPSYTYTAAGTYTVSLTATNAYGSDTNTKTDYITVSEQGTATMHVGNMVVGRKVAGPNNNGTCTVTIVDQDAAPLANATVYVTATGPTGGDFNGLTASDGTVSFATSKVRNPSGEWCFEVTNVTHATNTYDEASNVATYTCESGVVYGEGSGLYEALPKEFSLDQNHPNPFNPVTTIRFTVPEATYVRLDVFNITGQRVSTLVDGTVDAGQHSVVWDGGTMASGIYFYKIQVGDKTETRKMVLMK